MGTNARDLDLTRDLARPMLAFMDLSRFATTLVTVGALPDGVEHVAGASDGRAEGPHLIRMRDDEGLCIVSGNQDSYATYYGGVLDVAVTGDATHGAFGGSTSSSSAEQLAREVEALAAHLTNIA